MFHYGIYPVFFNNTHLLLRRARERPPGVVAGETRDAWRARRETLGETRGGRDARA